MAHILCFLRENVGTTRICVVTSEKRHYDAELGKVRGKVGKGTSSVTRRTDAGFIPRRGTLKPRRGTLKPRRGTIKPRRRFNFFVPPTRILVEPFFSPDPYEFEREYRSKREEALKVLKSVAASNVLEKYSRYE